jgi:sarcosine oxidase subunit beta
MKKTIVCSCEDITISELVSAMGQGFCEIESLKRYTGIGTGKCQGKCCLIQTLRVLASATGRKNIVAGATQGPGEPLEVPDEESLPAYVRLPTIRQPVIPLRIDDLADTLQPDESE